MSLSCYNLSDDWGWYVDIESSNYVHQTRKYCANFKQRHNKLEVIEEDDEYEYYLNNQQNLDDMSSKNIDVDIDIYNIEYVKQIYNIGSTMMISVLVTYIIFYML